MFHAGIITASVKNRSQGRLRRFGHLRQKKKKKKSFNKKLDKLKKKTALEKSKRHKKVLVKKSCP